MGKINRSMPILRILLYQTKKVFFYNLPLSVAATVALFGIAALGGTPVSEDWLRTALLQWVIIAMLPGCLLGQLLFKRFHKNEFLLFHNRGIKLHHGFLFTLFFHLLIGGLLLVLLQQLRGVL